MKIKPLYMLFIESPTYTDNLSIHKFIKKALEDIQEELEDETYHTEADLLHIDDEYIIAQGFEIPLIFQLQKTKNNYQEYSISVRTDSTNVRKAKGIKFYVHDSGLSEELEYFDTKQKAFDHVIGAAMQDYVFPQDKNKSHFTKELEELLERFTVFRGKEVRLSFDIKLVVSRHSFDIKLVVSKAGI